VPGRDLGCGSAGVGYRKVVLCECDAMTAISLAFPEAKCALMKTRILARAAESDSVEDKCAQACGLVSRTMARRDGGGAVHWLDIVSLVKLDRACLRLS
jgi:hypothetical protein